MKDLGILVIVMFVYVFGFGMGGYVGSNKPFQSTVQRIEQSVYEKELGVQLGAMKYKCNLVGGEFVTQSGKSACIINGSEL